jgi:hypothetical protein
VKGIPYRFLSPHCFIWLPRHQGGFGPIFSTSLPELLPPFFLLSKLSSASVSLTDVLELCDNMDWAGLFLVFGLLKRCDLLKFLFFFNFFFSSRTCCFNASTVSMFLSFPVWSLDDILFFGSTALVSRSVLDPFLYQCNCSGFHSSLTSDLTINLRSAFSEGDPLGHRFSSLEDRLVSGWGCSPSGITIGFFPFPKYIVTFSA